jgi:membrane-associated PAP2 superfamily phosphatase
MSYPKQMILYFVLLAAVILLFEGTNLDLQVQDGFYLQDLNRWRIDRHEPILRLLFYTGPKVLLISMGILCFGGWALSYKAQKYKNRRQQYVVMSLSLALVPLAIAGLKSLSNVSTPNKIARYGGNRPYVKVLETYPEGTRPIKRSQGWPAGHASGGFALMALYFLFSNPLHRWLGLGIGLTAGWNMGLYQTLNGQHFLSHTFVTMILAWMIIVSLSHWLHPLLIPTPLQQKGLKNREKKDDTLKSKILMEP